MIFDLERCYQLQTATGVEKPVTKKESKLKSKVLGTLQMMFQDDMNGAKSLRHSEIQSGLASAKSSQQKDHVPSVRF